MSATANKLKEYRHLKKSDEVTSALEVLRYVIGNDKLNKKVRQQIVDLFLWKIPEYEGKYNVRYWSERVLNQFQKGEPEKVKVEHVHQRKLLRDDLLSGKIKPEDLMEEFIICLVTEEEAKQLNAIKDPDGWLRYKKAQISVYDSLNKHLTYWNDL